MHLGRLSMGILAALFTVTFALFPGVGTAISVLLGVAFGAVAMFCAMIRAADDRGAHWALIATLALLAAFAAGFHTHRTMFPRPDPGERPLPTPVCYPIFPEPLCS